MAGRKHTKGAPKSGLMRIRRARGFVCMLALSGKSREVIYVIKSGHDYEQYTIEAVQSWHR